MTHCPGCDLPLPRGGVVCVRCGTLVGTPTTPILVDGRYELVETIGVGSMGVVHLAIDRGLGRRVALKMLAPEHLGDPAARHRFEREAAMLASVRSENVVHIFASGEHEGARFFAMEFVEGPDLEKILDEHAEHGAFIPTYRALTILRLLARGLGAVHDAGVVHRDVKPANIIVEEGTGRPVLVDFGLARPLHPDAGRRTMGAGSPGYMAPEQAEEEELEESRTVDEEVSVSPRSDVYALGCTAYQLFTGKRVFPSRDPAVLREQHAHGPPPTLAAERPELAAFDAALARALAKAPGDRFARCEDFAAALDRAAGLKPSNFSEPRFDARRLTSMPPSSRVRRILIVDDDEVFRKFVRLALQAAFRGVEARVASAGNGSEAIAVARRTPPDLVLLDHDMPGLDGIETLSRLRALPVGGDTRVVVISGTVGEAVQWRFSILGVNEFVRKPIDLPDLAAKIRDVIGRAGWLETSIRPPPMA